MNKDETVYLRHILECMRRIVEDTREGRARFLASHTLQDAVVRNLKVLAESTQRLSDTIKATTRRWVGHGALICLRCCA